MEESNTLIAEFMGYEVLYRPYSNGFIELSETELCDLDDLKYHTDWNWLMPVVEKIMHLCFENDCADKWYELVNKVPSKSGVYDEVVGFIKWVEDKFGG